MKIVFEQSGGFMGRTVNLTVDLGDLDNQQAEELRSLLQEAKFLDPEQSSGESLARDNYSYRITVETASVEQTIRVSDGNAPEELRPLIEELSKLARTQRR